MLLKKTGEDFSFEITVSAQVKSGFFLGAFISTGHMYVWLFCLFNIRFNKAKDVRPLLCRQNKKNRLYICTFLFLTIFRLLTTKTFGGKSFKPPSEKR